MLVAPAFVLVQNVEAKTICWEVYGGGEECKEVDENSQLQVNKTIWNPKSEKWEDHISSSSGSYPYTFSAEQTVTFRIEVKNTGDVKLKDIKVKDTLPAYIIYNNGDGNGTDNNKKVEFDSFDLDPGQSKTFVFEAKVADDGVLPKDDVLCLTNVAEAKGKRDDNDNEEKNVDYANFCLNLPQVKSKEVIKELPVTGINPTQEMARNIAIISTALGLILVGYGIKKLANN